MRSGPNFKDDVDIDDETLDDERDVGEPQDQPQVSTVSLSSKAQRGKRFLTLILLPAVALVLAVGAGTLKWQGSTVAADPSQVADSVRAASDGAVAILSYRP
ncbi:MAG: Mce-associated rane protein, partial [Mycobacterium sp.]|nr:Mce-associated rane protein [Mycobacterium sp.]